MMRVPYTEGRKHEEDDEIERATELKFLSRTFTPQQPSTSKWVR